VIFTESTGTKRKENRRLFVPGHGAACNRQNEPGNFDGFRRAGGAGPTDGAGLLSFDGFDGFIIANVISNGSSPLLSDPKRTDDAVSKLSCRAIAAMRTYGRGMFPGARFFHV